MARRPKKTAAKEPPKRQPPEDWQWWILAAGLPLVLCASKLRLDLWSDEAYTLIFFVSKPFTEIATDYSAPNNHVFYSLLLRPFYLISDSDFVLRLPSLLFTTGTLAMVFRLARRWGGLPAGVLATLTLGLTQMFLGHTMQIRGYGLSMFLAAWLADLTATRQTRWPELLAVVLAGAAFLYVLPTNVLFLLPLGAAAIAWAVVRDRCWRSAVATASALMAAGLLAGLLYLPIADQVLDARGEPVRQSLFAGYGLAWHVFSVATRDWTPILILAAAGLGCWIWKATRRPSRDQIVLPLFVLAMLLGPLLLTGLLGVRPFPRNYCPILPLLAVAIGWPASELLTALGRRFRTDWSDTATALVGMLLLAAVAVPKIWTYPQRLTELRRAEFAQDGYFNYYAANFHPAKVVAHLGQTISPDRSYLVCFSDADHFALAHYFHRAGLPVSRVVDGSVPVVYTITPELADYGHLSQKFDVPADVLESFPLVRDFGYYRLHRSGGSRGFE